MTFDAVAVARRGVGKDELQLVSPAFLDAVRWAQFAERMWDGMDEQQAIANTRISKGLTGQDLTDATAEKRKAAAFVKQRRVMLLLEDPDPPAEVVDG